MIKKISKKSFKDIIASSKNIDEEMIKGMPRSKSRGGSPWRWHYGQVKGLGYFSTAGGREVVIMWDEGGSSRKQGGISDEQWEIFKMAFEGTGRIAVLSDKADYAWKFDYRFLEAQR